MKGLEAAIVEEILTYLNSLPETYAIKMHGSVFTVTGTPDILGSHRGRMLAIEVKRAHPVRNGQPAVRLKGMALLYWNEGAAEIQAVQLARWRAAGALCGVVVSVDEVRARLGRLWPADVEGVPV